MRLRRCLLYDCLSSLSNDILQQSMSTVDRGYLKTADYQRLMMSQHMTSTCTQEENYSGPHVLSEPPSGHNGSLQPLWNAISLCVVHCRKGSGILEGSYGNNYSEYISLLIS
ncbi:unnamed protein product [Arctogadus glacialis]